MERLVLEHSELACFVVNKVKLTGRTIGAGAYGTIEEVTIPGAICAAKQMHAFLLQGGGPKLPQELVKECEMMSKLRHPNIVQFLGICALPRSTVPSILMEKMMTSLHDFLEPETNQSSSPEPPKSFIPLSLKRSILHDVASGLTYLHEQSPPIIHRDLSARNVLLNSAMVAKIADLGMARIIESMGTAASMTKAPGASVYMPPEALEACPGDRKRNSKERNKKARYDSSIDVFSFGVVSIFVLSHTFPCNLLAPTYRKGFQHIARTELERREEYMQLIYQQLDKKHPLVQMIEKCLDFPEKRPSITDIMEILEQVEEVTGDEYIGMNTLQLMQAIENETKERKKMSLEFEGKIEYQEVLIQEQQSLLHVQEKEIAKLKKERRNKTEFPEMEEVKRKVTGIIKELENSSENAPMQKKESVKLKKEKRNKMESENAKLAAMEEVKRKVTNMAKELEKSLENPPTESSPVEYQDEENSKEDMQERSNSSDENTTYDDILPIIIRQSHRHTPLPPLPRLSAEQDEPAPLSVTHDYENEMVISDEQYQKCAVTAPIFSQAKAHDYINDTEFSSLQGSDVCTTYDDILPIIIPQSHRDTPLPPLPQLSAKQDKPAPQTVTHDYENYEQAVTHDYENEMVISDEQYQKRAVTAPISLQAKAHDYVNNTEFSSLQGSDENTTYDDILPIIIQQSHGDTPLPPLPQLSAEQEKPAPQAVIHDYENYEPSPQAVTHDYENEMVILDEQHQRHAVTAPISLQPKAHDYINETEFSSLLSEGLLNVNLQRTAVTQKGPVPTPRSPILNTKGDDSRRK